MPITSAMSAAFTQMPNVTSTPRRDHADGYAPSSPSVAADGDVVTAAAFRSAKSAPPLGTSDDGRQHDESLSPLRPMGPAPHVGLHGEGSDAVPASGVSPRTPHAHRAPDGGTIFAPTPLSVSASVSAIPIAVAPTIFPTDETFESATYPVARMYLTCAPSSPPRRGASIVEPDVGGAPPANRIVSDAFAIGDIQQDDGPPARSTHRDPALAFHSGSRPHFGGPADAAADSGSADACVAAFSLAASRMPSPGSSVECRQGVGLAEAATGSASLHIVRGVSEAGLSGQLPSANATMPGLPQSDAATPTSAGAAGAEMPGVAVHDSSLAPVGVLRSESDSTAALRRDCVESCMRLLSPEARPSWLVAAAHALAIETAPGPNIVVPLSRMPPRLAALEEQSPPPSASEDDAAPVRSPLYVSPPARRVGALHTGEGLIAEVICSPVSSASEQCISVSGATAFAVSTEAGHAAFMNNSSLIPFGRHVVDAVPAAAVTAARDYEQVLLSGPTLAGSSFALAAGGLRPLGPLYSGVGGAREVVCAPAPREVQDPNELLALLGGSEAADDDTASTSSGDDAASSEGSGDCEPTSPPPRRKSTAPWAVSGARVPPPLPHADHDTTSVSSGFDDGAALPGARLLRPMSDDVDSMGTVIADDDGGIDAVVACLDMVDLPAPPKCDTLFSPSADGNRTPLDAKGPTIVRRVLPPRPAQSSNSLGGPMATLSGSRLRRAPSHQPSAETDVVKLPPLRPPATGNVPLTASLSPAVVPSKAASLGYPVPPLPPPVGASSAAAPALPQPGLPETAQSRAAIEAEIVAEFRAMMSVAGYKPPDGCRVPQAQPVPTNAVNLENPLSPVSAAVDAGADAGLGVDTAGPPPSLHGAQIGASYALSSSSQLRSAPSLRQLPTFTEIAPALSGSVDVTRDMTPLPDVVVEAVSPAGGPESELDPMGLVSMDRLDCSDCVLRHDAAAACVRHSVDVTRRAKRAPPGGGGSRGRRLSLIGVAYYQPQSNTSCFDFDDVRPSPAASAESLSLRADTDGPSDSLRAFIAAAHAGFALAAEHFERAAAPSPSERLDDDADDAMPQEYERLAPLRASDNVLQRLAFFRRQQQVFAAWQRELAALRPVGADGDDVRSRSPPTLTPCDDAREDLRSVSTQNAALLDAAAPVAAFPPPELRPALGIASGATSAAPPRVFPISHDVTSMSAAPVATDLNADPEVAVILHAACDAVLQTAAAVATVIAERARVTSGGISAVSASVTFDASDQLAGTRGTVSVLPLVRAGGRPPHPTLSSPTARGMTHALGASHSSVITAQSCSAVAAVAAVAARIAHTPLDAPVPPMVGLLGMSASLAGSMSMPQHNCTNFSHHYQPPLTPGGAGGRTQHPYAHRRASPARQMSARGGGVASGLGSSTVSVTGRTFGVSSGAYAATAAPPESVPPGLFTAMQRAASAAMRGSGSGSLPTSGAPLLHSIPGASGTHHLSDSSHGGRMSLRSGNRPLGIPPRAPTPTSATGAVRFQFPGATTTPQQGLLSVPVGCHGGGAARSLATPVEDTAATLPSDSTFPESVQLGLALSDQQAASVYPAPRSAFTGTAAEAAMLRAIAAVGTPDVPAKGDALESPEAHRLAPSEEEAPPLVVTAMVSTALGGDAELLPQVPSDAAAHHEPTTKTWATNASGVSSSSPHPYSTAEALALHWGAAGPCDRQSPHDGCDAVWQDEILAFDATDSTAANAGTDGEGAPREATHFGTSRLRELL